MIREVTIDKIKEYYDFEYKNCERAVTGSLTKDGGYNWIRTDRNRWEVISRAVDRLLGVACFVQTCDIPYDVIDPLYHEYKAKIEGIPLELA